MRAATAGWVTNPTMRAAPPQRGQISTSIANPRRKSSA
jgi:hypothetical protein